ncbi:MAG: phosphonate ABC transporter ATP-binding protein [Thermodesulfobacteriota bacterium]
MKIDNIEYNKSENIIEFKDVKFQYVNPGPTVLDIENLSISKGERVAIIGPSGSGKTTLFRMINGYIQPDSGYIKILEYKYNLNSLLPRNISRRIGFIFQDFNLIDRATVFQNVLWGRLGFVNPVLSLFGIFSKKDKQAAMTAIDDVNLLEYAEQRTDKLSGGQMQRVAIARVLVQEPDIILADEPISNLDPVLAEEILILLSELCQKYGVTLLMNIHQPALTKSFADRVIGLRDGKVVYDDSPNLVDANVLNNIFGSKVLKAVDSKVITESKSNERKIMW